MFFMHHVEKKHPKVQSHSFVNRHEGNLLPVKNDRPEYVLQRSLRTLAHNSPQSKRLGYFGELADTSSRTLLTTQRAGFSKPLAGKQPDDDIEQIFHLLGADEIASVIFEAYAESDQKMLDKFPQLIAALTPTEDLPAEKLAKVLTLWTRVSDVIKRKKSLRDPSTDAQPDTATAQPSTAPEQKPPEPKKLDGLVVTRMPAYVQQVKDLVQRLNFKQAPEIKTAADVVQALYKISSTILLPELVKEGVFPKLIIEDSMDADGQFSRTRWDMSISVEEDADKLAGLVSELSTTILHETRHVEQAWMEIWLVNRTPSREKVEVRLRRITDQVATAKKIAKLMPSSGFDDGIMAVVKAGQKHKYTRKATEDHDKVSMSHVTSGLSAASPPGFAAIHNYFLHEQEYYSHPREMDAYAVEREFKRKLAES